MPGQHGDLLSASDNMSGLLLRLMESVDRTRVPLNLEVLRYLD